MADTKRVYGAILEAHGSTGAHKVVTVIDKQVQNTDGGASTTTTWNTRTLTDIVYDPASIASLDTNKVTLPIGTYTVYAKAPAHGAIGVHKLRLYDVTADAAIVIPSQTVVGLAALQTHAELCGVFTLAAASEVRLEHYTTTIVADTGLGSPGNITDENEVYSIVTFEMQQDPTAKTSV